MLSRGKGKIRITPNAKRFITQDPKVSIIKWNGRKIRNTLQTVIMLAEFEAIEDPDFTEGDEVIIESTRFERVIKMSQSFHSYYDSIRGDTGEDRAEKFYGRNDHHDGI
jgi:hypothetical protein